MNPGIYTNVTRSSGIRSKIPWLLPLQKKTNSTRKSMKAIVPGIPSDIYHADLIDLCMNLVQIT
jgi:hypothetical protein